MSSKPTTDVNLSNCERGGEHDSNGVLEETADQPLHGATSSTTRRPTRRARPRRSWARCSRSCRARTL